MSTLNSPKLTELIKTHPARSYFVPQFGMVELSFGQPKMGLTGLVFDLYGRQHDNTIHLATLLVDPVCQNIDVDSNYYIEDKSEQYEPLNQIGRRYFNDFLTKVYKFNYYCERPEEAYVNFCEHIEAMLLPRLGLGIDVSERLIRIVFRAEATGDEIEFSSIGSKVESGYIVFPYPIYSKGDRMMERLYEHEIHRALTIINEELQFLYMVYRRINLTRIKFRTVMRDNSHLKAAEQP